MIQQRHGALLHRCFAHQAHTPTSLTLTIARCGRFPTWTVASPAQLAPSAPSGLVSRPLASQASSATARRRPRANVAQPVSSTIVEAEACASPALPATSVRGARAFQSLALPAPTRRAPHSQTVTNALSAWLDMNARWARRMPFHAHRAPSARPRGRPSARCAAQASTNRSAIRSAASTAHRDRTVPPARLLRRHAQLVSTRSEPIIRRQQTAHSARTGGIAHSTPALRWNATLAHTSPTRKRRHASSARPARTSNRLGRRVAMIAPLAIIARRARRHRATAQPELTPTPQP